MNTRTRKLKMGVAVLAASALLLTACSGGDDANNANNSTTVVVGVAAEPKNLNAAINTDQNSQMISVAVYDSLIEVDRAGNIHPSLATAWDISEDGKTYTFTLRDDVKWHDGEGFDAEDVIFSLKQSLPLHPSGAQIAALIEDAVAPDPYSVVVTLKSSYGPFLASMRRLTTPILPEHIYSEGEIADNVANMAPIGTGPFVFSEWITGDRVVLKKNDSYWGQEPEIEEIIFRFIPDSAARINTLSTGEVDYVMQYWIPYSAVSQLGNREHLHLEHGRVMPTEMWFIFNTESEYLSDVKVRQALIHGIDREQVNDSVYNGAAAPAAGIIPPGIPWAYDASYNLLEKYPYDIELANRLLDEAGYVKDASGKRFTLEYVYSNTNDPAQGPIGDIIKSSWSQLGIDVVLSSYDTAVWVEKLWTTHEFDIAVAQLTTRNDPALGISRVYLCVEPGRGYTNASQYCNQELDALWAEAASATLNEDRAVIYSEIQGVLSEDVPTVPIIDLTGTDVINKRFGNLEKFFDSAGHPELHWQYLTLNN